MDQQGLEWLSGDRVIGSPDLAEAACLIDRRCRGTLVLVSVGRRTEHARECQYCNDKRSRTASAHLCPCRIRPGSRVGTRHAISAVENNSGCVRTNTSAPYLALSAHLTMQISHRGSARDSVR
ncbi:hypothetical protein V2G26_003049 [Clonostachys chloroleuca]